MADIHYEGFDPRSGTLPMVRSDAMVLRPEFLYEPETATDLVDLRKIWSAIWRHRLLVTAIIAVSLALGVLALFLVHPTYRATSSVEIEDQAVKVLGTEDMQQSTNPDTDRLLQTQIDILKSRALAERVADALNLAGNDRFLAAQGVKPKAPIRREQVIQALRDNLVVTLPRQSRVVPIAFDSGSATLAATISNSYAENLIAGNLQRHYDTSTYSKDFLQNQLTLTKARLEQSERALLAYARSAGIVDPTAGAEPGDPSNGAPHSLTSANLIDLNQSLAAARATRIQAQGRWQQASGTPLMSLPDVLANPAINQMAQKRAELEAQYQEDLQHRKPEHPVVQQEAAALKALDLQMNALATSIRNSIRNQYETAQSQESQLASTVNRLKGATLSEQALGIRYNILKREVDTNRQLYDGLLQRYKEVSAEAGVTSNNISVIDRAEAPLLPVSPNPKVNILLSLIAGLVIALATVAALETFHDGVRGPDEVEQRFGAPLLGVIPRLKGPAQAQLADLSSPISEAYQTVRASVELSSENGTPRTLLVTSSREGEGKSTTALAMARDSAASGRRVLLIDADMRRPSIHTLVKVQRTPGLSNMLTQQLPASSVIYPTETEGLFVMPAGPKPPSPADLLGGAGFRALLTYLKQEFDQIIIDSPPVLGLADAPRLASIADGTLVVMEANRSHRGAITAAMRRLSAARAKIIGAVLVKFDPKKADSGTTYMLDYYSYGSTDEDDFLAGQLATS
ncbi:MAG TPA: polysaccharide biosynthesis tyrosine autokinase [Sphingomicrobium sp.]